MAHPRLFTRDARQSRVPKSTKDAARRTRPLGLHSAARKPEQQTGNGMTTERRCALCAPHIFWRVPCRGFAPQVHASRRRTTKKSRARARARDAARCCTSDRLESTSWGAVAPRFLPPFGSRIAASLRAYRSLMTDVSHDDGRGAQGVCNMWPQAVPARA